MPPKKNDKGKKDAKQETNAADEQEEERELVEKELIISYLRSKVGRYQDHGEKLQVENVKLNEDLELQKLNLRDINEFLTNELKARSLTTSALEAKVGDLATMIEDLKKSHEESSKKQKAERDREVSRLEALLAEHERRARVTQEYLEQKEQLEAELAVLRETLMKQTKEFDLKLTDLDRQHIQDREKWKREKAQKVKETKIAMMKLTDNQLEVTTKRTIMENEQMSVELSYQSRQTEKLLSKNAKLLQENGDLRRQLELSSQTEEELAKRNNLYQKTIKTLLAKLKDHGQQASEVNEDLSTYEMQISDLQSSLRLLELQAEEKDLTIQQLKDAVSKRRQDSDGQTDHRQDVAQFLLSCLADVKDKILTTVVRDRILPNSDPRYDTGKSRSLSAVNSTSTVTIGSLGGGEAGRGGGGGMGGGGVTTSGITISSGAGSPVLTGDIETDITVLPGKLEDLNLEQRERVLAFLLERLKSFLTSKITDGNSDFALAAVVNAQLAGYAPINLGGGGGGGGGGGYYNGGVNGGVSSNTSAMLLSGAGGIGSSLVGGGGNMSNNNSVHNVASSMNLSSAAGGGGGGGGLNTASLQQFLSATNTEGTANVTLPPIPQFNRRQYATHTPLATLGEGGASGGTPLAAMNLAQQLPSTGGTPSALAGTGGASMAGASAANSLLHQQPEATEELISKVVAEVRPWGKKAGDVAFPKQSGGMLNGSSRRAMVR